MASEPDLEVLGEIGAGATARVLRARLAAPLGGLPTGTEVAVKRLRPELAGDARARDAFEREARVGRSVRDPGLARLLHAGRDGEGPYLVQELVPGATLRERLERDGPLPEPRLRSVAAQVAGALAALHRADLVHGDVKPENVRLSSDGRAVLVDLGFARAADEADAGERPGSPAYLSPEEVRGARRTAAGDVFALGSMLYELATGRHPFLAGAAGSPSGWPPGSGEVDVDELLEAIAAAHPVPPSTRVPQLSPLLDHLLSEMLRRDPAERPAAEEVEQRFEQQERSSWWRAILDFGPAARRSPAAALGARHLTPLVGREHELGLLLERFRAAQGAPRPADHVTWLVGAPGSGKSRLVSEFAARARASEDPPLYLYARCTTHEDERPAAAIVRLFQRYLLLPPGAAPTARERALLGELLPPPQVASLLAAMDPDFDGATPVAVPVALAEWLAAVGRGAPTIAFLDDVQFADEGTLSVLSLLAPELARTRLGLVLGFRRGDRVRHPAALRNLAERLGTGWSTPGDDDASDEGLAPARRDEPGEPAGALELGPLEPRHVAELVDDLFHPTAPRLRIARVLHERSRGNAGLLAEILRALRERRELVPHGAGDDLAEQRLVLTIPPEKMPLPRSLPTAIAQRYRALPPEERRWLQRLAVVGGRLHPDFLVRAFPPTRRAEVVEVLAHLARAGWLEPAGDRYRFARPALREAVYRAIPAARRVRLHARAAGALQPRTDGHLSVPDAVQRAFHLHAAGEHRRLLRVIDPLVTALLRRGQPQRVHTLASWGLEALESLPRTRARDRLRVRLLEAAADAADRLGHIGRERTLLDRLTDLELDPERDRELLVRIYLLHGRHAASTGQYGPARGMLRNAVELARGLEATDLLSEALRRLSAVQAHVGELEEARALAGEALGLAAHDPQRAVTWLQIGVVDVLEDRLEAALGAVGRSVRLLRGSRGWRIPGAFAAAYLLRGRTYRLGGRPRRALASMVRAMRLARRAGERRLEIEATARLGGLLLETSNVAEAEARLREALLSAREVEDRRLWALAGLWLGELLLERGDPEADRLLARVEARAREAGLARLEGLALAVRARRARAAGDLATADRQSAASHALVERFGAELVDRIVSVGTRALVLEELGRGAEARSLVRELRRRLQRENARIVGPVLRRRHRAASTRLLESVLSPTGPVYPRVVLPAGLDPAELVPGRGPDESAVHRGPGRAPP